MTKKEWKTLAVELFGLFLIVVIFSAGFDWYESKNDVIDAAKVKKTVREENKKKSQPKNEFSSKVVVLDAGHGGIDQGGSSIGGKYKEKVYTLQIVRKVEQLLKKNTKVTVYCTRKKDCYVTKNDRVSLANAKSADLFISVHCNEVGKTSVKGVEVLYGTKDSHLKKAHSTQKLTSKILSKIMLKELIKETRRSNRGVFRRNGLYLMNHSKVPVTIVEVGYLSNPSDLAYIRTREDVIAKGIYNGIINALTYSSNMDKTERKIK